MEQDFLKIILVIWRGVYTLKPFLTKEIFAVSFETFSQPAPATKACTSESILDAAVIAFKCKWF